MLTSLTITDRSPFTKLHIEELAAFNLIVGKNGVGKSALLRALRYPRLCGNEEYSWHPIPVVQCLRTYASMGQRMNDVNDSLNAAHERRSSEIALALFDNIDAGLHHTRHRTFWDNVVDNAVALGVQVFATAHSWECLEGFAEMIASHDVNGQVIRLERDKEDVQTRAIILDRTDLPIVIRDRIEIR